MICVVYLNRKIGRVRASMAEVRLLVEINETGSWDEDRQKAIDKALSVLGNQSLYEVAGVTKQAPVITGSI